MEVQLKTESLLRFSVCFNISLKTAAACFVSHHQSWHTQETTTGTSRHCTNTQAQKWQASLYTSVLKFLFLLCFLFVFLKKRKKENRKYRAHFDWNRNKTINTENKKEIQRCDLVSLSVSGGRMKRWNGSIMGGTRLSSRWISSAVFSLHHMKWWMDKRKRWACFSLTCFFCFWSLVHGGPLLTKP